jgi:hypothetical protein
MFLKFDVERFHNCAKATLMMALGARRDLATTLYPFLRPSIDHGPAPTIAR